MSGAHTARGLGPARTSPPEPGRATVAAPTMEKRTMDFTKISNWLQITANVGIVGGLLLVGVQLKQNTDLLKTQLLYEESIRMVELETKVVGENAAKVWAKSLTDPQNLTLEEQRIMEALLWSYAEQLRSMRMLAELGLLENEEWRFRVRNDTSFFFGNRYGTAWWKEFSDEDTTMPQDLVDAVNARLSETSPDSTLEYMQGKFEYLDLTPADGVITPD